MPGLFIGVALHRGERRRLDRPQWLADAADEVLAAGESGLEAVAVQWEWLFLRQEGEGIGPSALVRPLGAA
jgi:hypothetical protein